MIENVIEKNVKKLEDNSFHINDPSFKALFIKDRMEAMSIANYDRFNAKGRKLVSWPLLEAHNLDTFNNFMNELPFVLGKQSNKPRAVRNAMTAIFIRVYGKFMNNEKNK